MPSFCILIYPVDNLNKPLCTDTRLSEMYTNQVENDREEFISFVLLLFFFSFLSTF